MAELIASCGDAEFIAVDAERKFPVDHFAAIGEWSADSLKALYLSWLGHTTVHLFGRSALWGLGRSNEGLSFLGAPEGPLSAFVARAGATENLFEGSSLRKYPRWSAPPVWPEIGRPSGSSESSPSLTGSRRRRRRGLGEPLSSPRVLHLWPSVPHHTWGESHGGGVGVVVDGCPPRLRLTRRTSSPSSTGAGPARAELSRRARNPTGPDPLRHLRRQDARHADLPAG